MKPRTWKRVTVNEGMLGRVVQLKALALRVLGERFELQGAKRLRATRANDPTVLAGISKRLGDLERH